MSKEKSVKYDIGDVNTHSTKISSQDSVLVQQTYQSVPNYGS